MEKTTNYNIKYVFIKQTYNLMDFLPFRIIVWQRARMVLTRLESRWRSLTISLKFYRNTSFVSKTLVRSAVRETLKDLVESRRSRRIWDRTTLTSILHWEWTPNNLHKKTLGVYKNILRNKIYENFTSFAVQVVLCSFPITCVPRSSAISNAPRASGP